jgi:uncharacterized protein (DUF1499 family)
MARTMKYISLIPLLSVLILALAATTETLDGLLAFRVIRYFLQFGAPLLLLIGIILFFRSQRETSAWYFINGLVGIAIIGTLFYKAHSYPMINDYTSDLNQPPTFQALQALSANKDRDMTFPQENVALIQNFFPEQLSIKTNKDRTEVFEKVKSQIENNQWQLIGSDLTEGTIEAVVTSSIFKFKDDFIVRLKNNPDGTLRIDFRSKSRVGKSDLGAKLKRIQNFKKDLETSLK